MNGVKISVMRYRYTINDKEELELDLSVKPTLMGSSTRDIEDPVEDIKAIALEVAESNRLKKEVKKALGKSEGFIDIKVLQ